MFKTGQINLSYELNSLYVTICDFILKIFKQFVQVEFFNWKNVVNKECVLWIWK